MKLSTTPRLRRAVAVGTLSAMAIAGLTAAGLTAAHADDPLPLDIVLGVGSDQTQRVVSWYYSDLTTKQSIVFEKGAALDASATTLAATVAKNAVADTEDTDADYDDTDPTGANDSGHKVTHAKQANYVNAHATLTGLVPGTTYSYKVGTDGHWSKTYTFVNGSADANNFQFLFFGDPQIGSSSHTQNDGEGWAQTLAYASTHDANAELYVSGGDQVEKANNEFQWNSFTDPKIADPVSGAVSGTSEVLKTHTWAPTIGNHEGEGAGTAAGTAGGGRAYSQHFFPPNLSDDVSFYGADGAQAAPFGTTPTAGSAGSTQGVHATAELPGGDYWYTYKNVLFVDLNSNAYAGDSDPAHIAFVTDVVKNHSYGTKYTVLVYHHSIYSPSASHANDADNSQRRLDFPYAFSKLGVDLVLQGHDHSYSRSYALKASAAGQPATKADPSEQPGATTVTTGPGGVVYITADSASGSKYYDLPGGLNATANGGDYGADSTFPTPKNDANTDRHWANSVEAQPYVPTYVSVSVTPGGLHVTDLATGSRADKTNSAYQHTSGIAAKADAGDKRLTSTDPKLHWEQTPGASIDDFTLKGGNSNNPPAGPRTVTVTKTVTKQVVPAKLKTSVAAKIKALTKKVKKARGTKKKKLKAQLAAYKAIQRSLR